MGQNLLSFILWIGEENSGRGIGLYLYCLTPVFIAPRVMMSGVKLRWLSYPSRFLILLSVTDSSVSAAPMPECL